ncbi:C40 family peptidase [Bifidobacterium thermophilum]|uniref:C40 family peptidase n=1 Tax=Bifidobacterium thermophilum TaxID=33905 RepID=UPI00309A4782
MVAVAAACVSLAATASSASAQSSTSATAITSSRSFPKTTTVKKNLLAESTSTSVDSNTNWGGIESLNPPQTKSTAEKEAEAKAAAEKAAAEAAAQAAAQAQQQAASRSASRSSLNSSSSSSSSSSTATVNPPDSATANALVAYAAQFVGVAPYVYGGNTPAGWDCSGFVQYVYAQVGISLPHSSGGQAAVGTAVPSLSEAQPGDIIANGTHAAIYVGNGMVVNALNKRAGTVYTPVAYAFDSAYSIRRLL